MRLFAFVIFTCLLIVLCGCETPTKITSVRAPLYAGTPERIFVVSDAAVRGNGSNFDPTMRKKMIDIAAACGAVLEVSVVNPLELNERIHDDRIKAFNADVVLRIRNTGGLIGGEGLRINSSHDLQMTELKTNKVIWQSTVIFYGVPLIRTNLKSWGEAFAIDITNGLKRDRILRGCEVIDYLR
jgi:hypothetical protein